MAKKKVLTVPERLRRMADTYEERAEIYGDNYKNSHGKVFASLFQEGMLLETPHDFNRFAALNAIVGKLTRYCNQWEEGGHQDSIHDAGVFCSMLEELDEIS